MLNRLSNVALWSLIFAYMLTGSAQIVPPTDDINARLSPYIRDIRFDYLSWIANASWIKLEQVAIGSPNAIDRSTRKHIVAEFLRLTGRILDAENRLEQIYTDPSIADPQAASTTLRAELGALYARQDEIAPLAEAILEEQVSVVLAEAGLTSGGQPLPRLLYHISPLPLALIVSPRDAIRQEANISLLADLPIDRQDALENDIAASLDVSALVVPVGGIGIYPTMGMRSTYLPGIVETMAHEWAHNYLTWHPLGLRYGDSPEMRTINETTASIVGNEISRIVLEKYYPELLIAPRPNLDLLSWNERRLGPDVDPPRFNYREEMRRTRLRVDELLAAGKVDEAEAYMNHRREVFWNNGYGIRKLNQAFFAFYGAYADAPGGAAGEDPVGPAVRALRAQSGSLAAFVRRIMWVKSFADLQDMLP